MREESVDDRWGVEDKAIYIAKNEACARARYNNDYSAVATGSHEETRSRKR